MDGLCAKVAALRAFLAEFAESGYSGGGAGLDCARFRPEEETAPVAASNELRFWSSLLPRMTFEVRLFLPMAMVAAEFPSALALGVHGSILLLSRWASNAAFEPAALASGFHAGCIL